MILEKKVCLYHLSLTQINGTKLHEFTIVFGNDITRLKFTNQSKRNMDVSAGQTTIQSF
jgi:hypothetical protein